MYSFPSGISVIICCFNSARRIPKTLAHIANQKFGRKAPWEIILVNNNSSDNTVDIAVECWKQHGLSVPFQIVDQTIPGLTYAREKGVEVSRYEYLLFCDDDNWLDENYVERAYNIMREKPEVGALGGAGLPTSENEYEYPSWFHKYKSHYATGAQGPLEGGDTTHLKGCLYGAGMVIRKSALHQIRDLGIRFSLSDRVGASLTSGGDTETTYMLRTLGYRLWYDPKLTFYHYLPKSRVDWQYLLRLNKSIGGGDWVLEPYSTAHPRSLSKRKLVVSILRESLGIISSSLKILMKETFPKEGSHRVLYFQRRLGRLSFMLRDGRSLYNENIKNISRLSAH